MDKSNSIGETTSSFLGCGFFILVMAYGLTQIFAGYVGLQHHAGTFWAVVALIALFTVRFSIPLTIGAFLAAKNVWGWHWLGALVFAMPSLLFVLLMVPSTFTAFINLFRRQVN